VQAARARIRFELPTGWAVYSSEHASTSGVFEVPHLAKAVFFAGAGLRTKRKSIDAMDFGLVTSGEWAFEDADAFELAAKIIRADEEVFGAMPGDHAMLFVVPFPTAVASEKWSAETRGSTVTLVLGKQPATIAAMSQLSVPLTHELFHLWVPNALALDGDYGWFYEGFTIYQAARTAMRLQLLTFDEFLIAIGRAYDSYLASPGRDQLSLIEASQRRWTTGETVVYQKAMLAAVLYDLTLRNQSRGKQTLDNAYRQLFRQYRLSGSNTDRTVDGNEAALSALSSMGTREFAQTLVSRPVSIDLEAELTRFGLSVERIGLRSRVVVNESLSKHQRDLLRELGYNDEARIGDRNRSRKR